MLFPIDSHHHSHPQSSLLVLLSQSIFSSITCRSGLFNYFAPIQVIKMSSLKATLALGLLALAELAAGHGAIIKATGDAGGEGMALGINSQTPRDGTRRNPFQQDSTRFKGASAATFGETVGAGANNLEQGTQAIMAETGSELPQVSQGGEVKMTLHQVNADGGGMRIFSSWRE
jgi:hypothetical protein